MKKQQLLTDSEDNIGNDRSSDEAEDLKHNELYPHSINIELKDELQRLLLGDSVEVVLEYTSGIVEVRHPDEEDNRRELIACEDECDHRTDEDLHRAGQATHVCTPAQVSHSEQGLECE